MSIRWMQLDWESRQERLSPGWGEKSRPTPFRIQAQDRSAGTVPSLLSQMLLVHREILQLFQHKIPFYIPVRLCKGLTLIIELITRRGGEEKCVLWRTSLIRGSCIFQYEKPPYSVNREWTPCQVQPVHRTLAYQFQDWRAHLALLGSWPWLKISGKS